MLMRASYENTVLQKLVDKLSLATTELHVSLKIQKVYISPSLHLPVLAQTSINLSTGVSPV